MDMFNRYQTGIIHPLFVTALVLGVLVVGLGAFSIWAFINYQDQKNNTDAKIAAAVAEAQKQQSEEDDKLFAEREKQPTRQLEGPADLGAVTLDYPKTWSVYIDKSGSNNQFDAYMHPGVVPPLGGGTAYALRVTVSTEDYGSAVQSFQAKVKNGELKASTVTVAGEDGTRLDGTFSKDIQGSMVLFKVRDKTLRVQTQSRTFQGDFDNIVLKTLTFNK